MIRLKGHGAVYGELWYDEAPPSSPGVDVLLYRKTVRPVANARPAPFLSLVTNLAGAEVDLTQQFNQSCRYDVRRAHNHDELVMEFDLKPEGRLEDFGAFFDDFAREKSIWLADRRWLSAACAAGQLILSSVSHGSEALVWHAYVVSGHTAGLQYSGSRFRNRGRDYQARVARANRWLHWQDMLRLKDLGFTHYDWGGIFTDESLPERAGINNFKRSFGPATKRSFDCSLPVTGFGKLWLPLRDAWRARKSASCGAKCA